IKKAQNGNEESKTKLLVENSPLIKSIVRRYRGRGIEYEDLYQLGCMGFLKAVKNFTFEFEVRFSTYAVPMIMGEIKRYLRDDGYIKISRTIKSDAVKINAYVEKFRQEKQSSPTVDDIAKEFEMNPHDVAFVMDSTKVPLSIYDNCDDDNSRQIIDKIPSEENENGNINKILLKELIRKLPEREKKLIILRYFRGATQCEVARQLGVSQVQVSRIENKVINMLKEEVLK
ncbi:MAG: SigB/SigF/SigG family RNA polymerase sigma factor, partial [Clostridia bacterium]|nr:SigB/SigF/SigG family RNA polymerase sigma factor [Clostridia bacterium]